jgi:hypothetical protein
VHLDPGWTHTTYCPSLLLVVSSVYSLVLVALLIGARRTLGQRLRANRSWLPVLLVVLSPVPVVLVAREHVPVLGSLPFLPHPSFCFGTPGAAHLIAFALPVISTLVALRIDLGFTRRAISVPRP